MTNALALLVAVLLVITASLVIALAHFRDHNTKLLVDTRRLQRLLDNESDEARMYYELYTKLNEGNHNLYEEVRRLRIEKDVQATELVMHRLNDSMEYGSEWPPIMPPNWYGVKQFAAANTNPVCTEYYLPLEADATASKGKRVVLNRWPDCWWARIEASPELQKKFREHFSYRYLGDQTKTWKRGLTAISEIEKWLVENAIPFYPRQVEEVNDIPA